MTRLETVMATGAMPQRCLWRMPLVAVRRTATAAFLLVLLTMTTASLVVVVEAQTTDDASNALSEIAAVGNLPTTDFDSLVVSVLMQNLPLDAPRLILMYELPGAADVIAPKICDGLPALVVNSQTQESNKACFSKPMPAHNLSCSCLEGYTASDESWEINVAAVEPLTGPVPPTLSYGSPVGVGSLSLFGLPAGLKTFKLIGNSETPIPMDLKKPPFPGIIPTTNIVLASDATTVENMYLENMDFSGISIKSAFVPGTVKHLTIKNCNVRSLPDEFMQDLSALESLDASQNDLTGIFTDISAQKCVSAPQRCIIKALNISSNRMKTFPSQVFNFPGLESLSMTDNPFKKVVLSSVDFEKAKNISTFEVDTQSASDCEANSKLKTISSMSVCVDAAVTADAGPSASNSGGESDANSYLMYGIIGGCLVIAVLIFVVIKRRGRSDEYGSKGPLDAYFDNTMSFDESHPTVNENLLSDPIIITNRIPYNDLRVANCVSKGGFGLVYSGVYKRQRVAIKKIRPDRAGDIKQIEAFLREICLMATLEHPHIVEFIGVAWDSLRNLCAVTEYMDRGDLRDVLHGFKLRKCSLTWANHKTTIALHIADGLTYLHSLTPKVIHRDLKSKNVLLNSELHAKLSDFGISRERKLEETHMTAGIGTSFWIAPEVLMGKDYDEMADIYSYGVVLSEIDTDDYPYWSGDHPNIGNKSEELSILHMVAAGEVKPGFSDTCPKDILELAESCLQLDPDSRPTAAEIVYTLHQILQFTPPPDFISSANLR